MNPASLCSGLLGNKPFLACGKAPHTLLLVSPQGAVVGLIAGLAMAFWVGIGSMVMNYQSVSPDPTVLATDGNLTTAVMTTLLTSTTAPER